MNSIRKVLTSSEKRASEIYFVVVAIQSRVVVVTGVLSLLFGLSVRFAIRGGGWDGLVYSLLLGMMSFIVFTAIGFWSVGYIMSLGDDSYKRRDRLGRYEAERLFVESHMQFVETATAHRSRGGKLVGYMVGDRYLSVEQLSKILTDQSGVGGFSSSKNVFREGDR